MSNLGKEVHLIATGVIDGDTSLVSPATTHIGKHIQCIRQMLQHFPIVFMWVEDRFICFILEDGVVVSSDMKEFGLSDKKFLDALNTPVKLFLDPTDPSLSPIQLEGV